MKEYLSLLGTVQCDRVTGFKGTVGSISFDAYGCVQALLTPAISKDKKLGDSAWFDVKRLAQCGKRVMPVPSFAGVSMKEIGAAEKPALPQGPR